MFLSRKQNSEIRGHLNLRVINSLNLPDKAGGGGLLTAIEENLCSVLVFAGNEAAEILVVQAQVGKLKIRIFNLGHRKQAAKTTYCIFGMK